MRNANKTRDRILDAALTLFNESGTYTVTTNHIAEAAQLSVGNLYYHFKNKEEIIRALYERLDRASDAEFKLPADRVPGIADLERLVEINFVLLWQYRFFYREIMGLTHRDPQLAAMYRSVRERGYRGFGMLFEHFRLAGIFRAATPQEVQDLAEVCWILSEFYLSFVELGGAEPTDAIRAHGIALFHQTLQPYLTVASTSPIRKEDQ